MKSDPDLQIQGRKIRLDGPSRIDPAHLLDLRIRNQATWNPVSAPVPPGGYTPDFQQRALRAFVKQWRRQRDYVFGVVNRDGELAGLAALESVYFGAYRTANLGFVIDQGQAGQGFATEAVQLLLGFAFNGLMLQRIQAGIQADNEASRRVLVKCGFEREGVARDFLLIEEGWKDHVIYATTRPDYIRATVTS